MSLAARRAGRPAAVVGGGGRRGFLDEGFPETERVAAGLGILERLERVNPEPRRVLADLERVHDVLHRVEAAVGRGTAG